MGYTPTLWNINEQHVQDPIAKSEIHLENKPELGASRHCPHLERGGDVLVAVPSPFPR